MALRLIQLLTSAERQSDIDQDLKDIEPLEVWKQPLDENTALTQLLIRDEQSQHAIDTLEERFGEADPFRLMMFTIDATVPMPPEDDENEDEQPDDLTTSDKDQPKGAKKSGLAVSREELHSEMSDGIRITKRFVGMALLSSIVASFGLVRNDVAVIIGAMVIAPLLLPNVALSLATTLGDMKLARRSAVTNAIGIGITLAPAVVIGLVVTFDPQSVQIAVRTNLSIAVVFIALGAGSAGALSFTSGVAAGLIGVMVAVALLPPLAAAGMLLGAGDFALAGKAGLIVLTNVICVNLAGVVTFLFQGVRPHMWWDHDRAKRSTIIAVILWTVLLAGLIVLLIVLNNSK